MESILSHKSIRVDSLKKLMQPFVYGWCRDGEYLYIGQTRKGFIRLLGSHHVFGFAEPLRDGDYVDFWFVPQKELLYWEQKLIDWHHPKYNGKPVRVRKRKLTVTQEILIFEKMRAEIGLSP